MKEYSSQIVLPVKARQIPTKDEKNCFLLIKCDNDWDKRQKDADWSMHVLIKRNYDNLLKIRLKFRPDTINADEISQDQAKFAASLVTEFLKLFLGSNQKYFISVLLSRL